MKSRKLQVFDPPQCCSTGICGPDVDPVLVQFAADLRQISVSGFSVDRYNLAQQPEAFMQEPIVVEAVNAAGTSVLPIILVDGVEASRGRYPTLGELQSLLDGEPDTFIPLGIDVDPSCCDPSEPNCC